MSFESFSNEPKNVADINEKLVVEKGYKLSELGGHDPKKGVWQFQVLQPIDSNQEDNVVPLNLDDANEYAEELRLKLKAVGEFDVTVTTTPVVTILVEQRS